MSVHVDFTTEHFEKAGLKVFGAFEKMDKDGNKKAVLSWSDKDLSTAFGFIKDNGDFTGSAGTSFTFTGTDCTTVLRSHTCSRVSAAN